MLDVPIFLTGFMGVGKSKIGELLAQRLHRVFLDTDQMIEARAGKAISAIFASQGEGRFRQLEHECVQEVAAREDAVISLGGGAIAQERNWEVVRGAGVLVCIEADVETILDRVSRREDRPLLAGLSRKEKRAEIQRLLAARAPFYARADIRVQSTDDRPAEETAEMLIESLEEWCANRRSSPRGPNL